MELFDNINKEGKTVIVATHHQGIIEKMKRRMVIMQGGKIISDSGAKQKAEVPEKPEDKASDKSEDHAEEKQKVKVEVSEAK